MSFPSDVDNFLNFLAEKPDKRPHGAHHASRVETHRLGTKPTAVWRTEC